LAAYPFTYEEWRKLMTASKVTNSISRNFKRWLAPPVFPNDETRTRRAIFLNSILLTSLALVVFIIAGNLTGSNVPVAVNAVDIFFIAMCLILRHWAYQGRIKLAGVGLLAVGLVGITTIIAMMGTIRVPAAGVYMLLVIVAGLLFDLGGMIAMTAICALTIAGLIVAENTGQLPIPNYSNSITQWVTYTALFAWVGSLTLFSLQSTRQALTRAEQEITERKRAEKALRESESLYRLISENAADVIWKMNAVTGKFTYVSPSVQKLRGYAPDEVMKQPVNESLTPDSLKRVSDLLAVRIPQFLAQESGTVSFMDEVDQPRRDGSIVNTEVTTTYLRNERGEVEIIGVSRDITARKQAEDALRYSQTFMNSIIEHSPTSLWISDEKGTLIRMNRACREILQLRDEEVVGKYNIFNDNLVDEQGFMPLVRDVFEKGSAARFVISYDTAAVKSLELSQSARVVLDVNISPILDPQGKVINAIIQHIDITERVQAEEALRENEQNLQILFETMSEGVALNEIIYDENGEMVDYRILNVNRAFYSTADYRGSDVVGNVATNLYGMSPEFIKEFWKQHKEKNSTAYAEMYSPLDNHCFFITTSPFINDRFVTSFFDITERKQAEQALRESESRLKFSQQVAHLGHWTWDTVANRVTWSDEMKRIFGLDPAVFDGDLGKVIAHAIHPDDREKVNQSNAVVITEQKPVPMEYRVVWSDGSIHTVWAEAGEKIFGADGKILQLSGIVQDITARKQAEEKLRESEDRYRRLVENAPDIVYTFSNQRGGIYYSPRVEQVLGYSPEHLYAHPMLWNESIHLEDRPRIGEILRDFEVGKPFDIEYRIQDARGNWRWLRDRSIGRDVGDGEVLIEGLATDITERKMIENELREKTEELNRYFSSSLDLFCIADTDGYFRRLNPQWEKTLGYSLADLEGKRFLDFVHPEDVEVTLAAVSQLDKQQEVLNFENRYRCKDGSYRWIEWKSMPAGKLIYAAARDITERRRAEASIAALALRNQTLLQTASDGIHMLDDQGNIVEANAAFCNMLGYTREEMSHLNVADWDAQWSSAELLAKVRELIAHPAVFETRQRRKDGTFLDVEINSVGVTLEGRAYLYAAARDVTERKQAEAKLRENNKFLADLFEYNATVIFVKDREGRYELVNRKYEEITGISREAIIGHTDADFFSAEVCAQYRASDVQVLESGKALEMEDFIDKPGGRQYLFTVKFPLHADDGSFRGVCGITNDITERKQVEAEILQLNANLEQRVEERTRELRDAQEKIVRQEKLSVLGQMAGSVGHELRNPLGVMSNAVYFLKMIQPDAPDKVKEYLDLIQKNIRISDKIVGDLLDFTRIKSVDRVPVSVSNLIRQTLERFPVPESVQVEIDVAPNLPQAYADPQHVIQILGNLVLNACQAMKDGGKLLILSCAEESVQTESSITNHQLRITIRDTGSGIAPENMKKLFEPLFTTKTRGIGLGLAVSKKLIEANGGRIEVESELGRGSTFTIYLPVYKPGL
jgi:PAS domain S-box-containing protein